MPGLSFPRMRGSMVTVTRISRLVTRICNFSWISLTWRRSTLLILILMPILNFTSPETGSIDNLPQSELFLPPPTSRSSQDPIDETNIPSPALERLSTPKSSPPVAEPPSPPVRATRWTRRGKLLSVVDLTKMDVDDEPPPPVPDPKHAQSQPHEDEIESDDILGLAPHPSQIAVTPRQSSKPQLQSISLVPYLDEDDERDELDLLGSLSPSVSPPSRTSIRQVQERSLPAIPGTATVTSPGSVEMVDATAAKEGEEEEDESPHDAMSEVEAGNEDVSA